MPARSHALPFRVLLEEARRCRPKRLHSAVAKVLLKKGSSNVTEEQAHAAVCAALVEHEDAYDALERNAFLIEKGDSEAPKKVDKLLHDCADADRPLKRILHEMSVSALCLSGGGIRSASFALGVLEGLAQFTANGQAEDGLLSKIDYLSTVSGGGYIGSWLMAWVYRRRAAVVSQTCCVSYQQVIYALAGQWDVTAGDPEPATVRHLRSYTSFLAPALGLTLDSFTLIAIVLRNLLVNWAMLLPVLFTLAALGQISGYLLISVKDWLFHFPSLSWLRLIQGAIFALAALAASVTLPSHNRQNPTARWRLICERAFLVLVPLGVWFIAAYPLPNGTQTGIQEFSDWFGSWSGLQSTFAIGILSYGLLAFGNFKGYSKRMGETIARGGRAAGFWRFRGVVAALMAITAFVIAVLSSVLINLIEHRLLPALVKLSAESKWLSTFVGGNGLYTTLSVPLIIAAILSTTSLFCAILGIFEFEEDREWWVRNGGALIAFSIGWLLVHAIVFFGPPFWHSMWVATGGLSLGLIGSFAGFSGATPASTHAIKASDLGAIGKFLQKHNLVLPLTAGTALLLISLGVITLAQKLNHILQGVLHQQFSWQWAHCMYSHGWHAELGSALVLFLSFLVLMLLMNFAININLFSLHGMYRMRLMRAFLGASNVARRPDPFTRFDPDDTPLETDLPSEEGAPLHVICTTLNLVGTRNTAWRQRRAESFTFSPVFAGGWRVGYVEAGRFGGTHGVTLATALSISGAAFNPNMGYQSSPLLSLLMTFFNLRLGYWLPNPKRGNSESYLRKSGPSFALKPLLAEALGQTDDTNRWIELTDGGHFENLALYEMVMRRCKLIIVSDAGADPKCQFEDLGNAIRKIQIDLGVRIVFPNGLKMKEGRQGSNKYCSVARIEYQWVDDPGPGQTAEDLVGYLIYIKAGLNGSEPMDVQQYASVHPTFPHETTANQFFDEPQFESYRKLGFHEVMTIAAPRQVMPGSPLLPVPFSASDFLGLARDYAR